MDSQISSTPALQQTPTPVRNSPKHSSFKILFVGLNGVRSGWRVLLFYVLIFSIVLVIRAVRALLTTPHQPTNVLTPCRALLNEGVFLFGVLVTSAIFARAERRSFADYGLPVQGPGLLWGVALISCVLLVLKGDRQFLFRFDWPYAGKDDRIRGRLGSIFRHFAIGIHAAWDWGQSFLYGVPDSGITFAGHLLNPSFHGSKWMTGGTAGPEASVVTLLGYVFAFALINLRFPETRYTARTADLC